MLANKTRVFTSLILITQLFAKDDPSMPEIMLDSTKEIRYLRSNSNFTDTITYQNYTQIFPRCPSNKVTTDKISRLDSNKKLSEVSFLAISTQIFDNEMVMWLGNDGNEQKITAAKINGEIIRTFDLDFEYKGDTESMSIGPCHSSSLEKNCLYIGFLGNNGQRYKRNYILKFPEPDLSNESIADKLKGVTLVIDYSRSDGNPSKLPDCESIFVDFTGDSKSGNPGDIYLITKMRDKKKDTRAFLFPVSAHENAAIGTEVDDVVMEIVAKPGGKNFDIAWLGADMSRDGDLIIGRYDRKTYIWTRNVSDESVGEALEKEPCQSFENESKDKNDKDFETVAFTPTSNAFIEISECDGDDKASCDANVWINYLEYEK